MTPTRKSEGRRGDGSAPRRSRERMLLDEKRHRDGNEVAAALAAKRQADSRRSGIVADMIVHAVGPIGPESSADWSSIHASLPDDAGVVAGCTCA